MKVYGTIVSARASQYRCVVAAKNQLEAAERLGISVSHLRAYGSITGNVEEVALATGKPGTVFWADARKPGLRSYTERPA